MHDRDIWIDESQMQYANWKTIQYLFDYNSIVWPVTISKIFTIAMCMTLIIKMASAGYTENYY